MNFKFLGKWMLNPQEGEDLMPRDIMSSEPRHWMVFGQLVMPVQCCAEAPAAAVPQRTAAASEH